ncbi:MAG: hypothetical protein HYW07_02985, partial [Candidatus Latescibacteria bacterium]|nr:hypothetical protein [Candidatus Latescibacterota bacterium]
MISAPGKNLIRWQAGIVHPAMIHLTRLLVLWSVFLPLLGLSLPAHATEPILARLSFWVPPARKGEFESVYQEQIAPILKRQGWVESPQRGRATTDSVFSRLFVVGTASEIASKWEAVAKDSVARRLLQQAGKRFGTAGPDNLIRGDFKVYLAPAGAGRIVASGAGMVKTGKGRAVRAGSGFRQGVWHNLDVSDGLPEPAVFAVLQDREGYLWFGTVGGVSRYDGHTFTTFTSQDGLAHNEVRSIFQDREGHWWFGTDGGGVSRYDGHTFTTFTSQDGLAHNEVQSIFQDREGYLWFGTDGGGVSRYDGHTFTTFTSQDGLAHNE